MWAGSHKLRPPIERHDHGNSFNISMVALPVLSLLAMLLA